MAASTGGPAALHRLLKGLPSDFGTPILVVQHIAQGFASGLAEWLNSLCSLRVKLAEQDEPLAPGVVYLAPDDRHLGVASPSAIALSSSAAVRGFRPSGTYLFESAARAFGAELTAIVLTGMGEDGVEGLRAVRRTGGRIVAQDESSSVVWGMPGAAVAAGLPDLVLPPDKIAATLIQDSSLRDS